MTFSISANLTADKDSVDADTSGLLAEEKKLADLAIQFTEDAYADGVFGSDGVTVQLQGSGDTITVQLQRVPSTPAQPGATSPASPPADTGTSTPAAAGDTGSAPVDQPQVSTPPAAPDQGTAQPPTTDLARDESGRPLYEFNGQGDVDITVWPLSDLKASDGRALYTFSGDQAGGDATGASDEWTPYHGTTQNLTLAS